MRKRAALVVLLAMTSACARLPPVNFNYYPSKGVTSISVTQTFDCSADKTRLVVVTTTPAVTTSYSADHSQRPVLLEVSKTRGELSDTDITINYYDDGRLKSINSVSTGQGEAALKTAISIVGAALPLVGGAGSGGPKAPKLPECDDIANWGKDKPVSIVFTGAIDLATNDGKPVNLTVAPDSAVLFGKLNRAAPQVMLTVERSPIIPAARPSNDTGSYVPLMLQKVYPAKIEVMQSGAAFWTGRVLVPKGEFYGLPIPKAALFGKTTVVVHVAESGAVTSIQYGKQTGASGALNVLSTGVTAITPDTDAAKANEVKAQADLIAQSQRLARCQAQPDKCQ